jgi:hypothetical protein
VVFTDRAAIPRTTSGKLRRNGCRDAFLRGELRSRAENRS